MTINKTMTVQATLVQVRQRSDSPNHAYITLMQSAGVEDGVFVPAQSLTMGLSHGVVYTAEMDEFISTLIDLRIAMELHNAKPVGSHFRLHIGKHEFLVEVPKPNRPSPYIDPA